jgi:hypothetical protein
MSPPQEAYAPARDYAPAPTVSAPRKAPTPWSYRLGLAAGWLGLALIVS